MVCNKIFEFDSIGSNSVLRYFTDEKECQVFSYDKLRVDANKLAYILNKLRKSEKNQRNIIIFLATHSPALIPAIVA